LCAIAGLDFPEHEMVLAALHGLRAQKADVEHEFSKPNDDDDDDDDEHEVAKLIGAGVGGGAGAAIGGRLVGGITGRIAGAAIGSAAGGALAALTQDPTLQLQASARASATGRTKQFKQRGVTEK
jgi:hypothetical protein